MSAALVGTILKRELAALLLRYKAKSIFLVTGKRSYALSGAEEVVNELTEGRRLIHFNEFSPNPTLEEVERGVALFRGASPDLVLSIGGGTALDLGKMINGVASSTQSIRELLTGAANLETASVPLIAVPTTSGSGAEATHFSAVYVDQTKYSVTHECLRPTHAILDASLTRSLSPYLTAATGMDALAQGIESYWSLRSTPESRLHSAKAIELCGEALVAAATSPTDGSREAMLQGSFLAGQAIDVARTTAPHALSYVLTTDFGVTHGHAVALTLGAVFSHNAATEEKASAGLADTMAALCRLLHCANGDAARLRLEQMMQACDLKTRLRDVGVTRSDLPRLASSVNPQRLKNNPRELSTVALGQILESVY